MMVTGHRTAPALIPDFLDQVRDMPLPCRAAPDLFVSFQDQRANRRARVRQAAVYCARCPLILECRAWGIENQQHGVWGGVDLEYGREYSRKARYDAAA